MSSILQYSIHRLLASRLSAAWAARADVEEGTRGSAYRSTAKEFWPAEVFISPLLLEPFASAGADHVTVHVEAVEDPVEAARAIRAGGLRAGLSIRPGTPV